MACLLLALLPGCDNALTYMAGEAHGGSLANSNWNGSNASVSSASFVTARTQSEWDALWQTVGQPTPGTLPSGKMAVAVFLGQRFEAGTRVEIRDAEILTRVSEPEHAIVTYRELAQPGAVKTDTALSPWAIRLMNRSVLAPDFQKLEG